MSTMDKQATCAERIASRMESREDDLRTLYAAAQGEDGHDWDGEELDEETAQERLDEYPLAVSTYRVLRVDLSTGGPADYIEARLAPASYGSVVESVTYHFADWFDHAEEKVPEDSPLWQLAEYYAETIEP